MTIEEAGRMIATRLTSLFRRDGAGHRAFHGASWPMAGDPYFTDLVNHFEFFDGDDGRGCGASHQTGEGVDYLLGLGQIALCCPLGAPVLRRMDYHARWAPYLWHEGRSMLPSQTVAQLHVEWGEAVSDRRSPLP